MMGAAVQPQIVWTLGRDGYSPSDAWSPLAVDPVVVIPQRHQGWPQLCIATSPCRRRPGFGVVVSARGHRHPRGVQDDADGLDPELAAVGVDEVDSFEGLLTFAAKAQLSCSASGQEALPTRLAMSGSRHLRVAPL